MEQLLKNPAPAHHASAKNANLPSAWSNFLQTRFMNTSLFERLRHLEEKLSHVRKTKSPHTFTNLQTLEEVSIIRQAKREHHPITAEFSGKAFINLDSDSLFKALEDRIIDYLIEDTPLLKPFLEEALGAFKLTTSTYDHYFRLYQTRPPTVP
jgi:hypothetical protein